MLHLTGTEEQALSRCECRLLSRPTGGESFASWDDYTLRGLRPGTLTFLFGTSVSKARRSVAVSLVAVNSSMRRRSSLNGLDPRRSIIRCIRCQVLIDSDNN
ncbi:hypothetical protein LSAT2_009319, partial [Lamellibrachia satsuma]